MKYILTQKQYDYLIEQSELNYKPRYGDMISLGGETEADSDKWRYGDIMTLSGKKEKPPGTKPATTDTKKFDLFFDKGQTRIAGNYEERSMQDVGGQKYEIKIGNWDLKTSCEKLKKGDYSFEYSKKIYYSKQLARKVGDKFGCKFKES